MSDTKDVKDEARALLLSELRSLSQKFYEMHFNIENKAYQKPKPYRLRNGDEFERPEEVQRIPAASFWSSTQAAEENGLENRQRVCSPAGVRISPAPPVVLYPNLVCPPLWVRCGGQR
jgi:hypothetical protein